MTTVYFKQSTGGSVKSFSAYNLEVFFDDSDKTEYTTIAGANRKIIHFKHKGWEITLGFISTEADLDWLAELKALDYPQFSTDGSTYHSVIVKSISPKTIGTKLNIIKQTAET